MKKYFFAPLLSVLFFCSPTLGQDKTTIKNLKKCTANGVRHTDYYETDTVPRTYVSDYAPNGNLIKNSSYFMGIGYYKHFYEYNSSNLVVKEIDSNYMENIYSYGIVEYEYDKYTNLTKKQSKGKTKGDSAYTLSDFNSTVYTYNDKDSITSEKTNDSVRTIEWKKTTYEPFGKTYVFHKWISHGANYADSVEYKYEYNSEGLIAKKSTSTTSPKKVYITDVLFTYSGKTLVKKETISEKNLVKVEYFGKYGPDSTFAYKNNKAGSGMKWVYDKKGQLIEEYDFYAYNKTWTLVQKYDYNNTGKLIKHFIYDTDEGVTWYYFYKDELLMRVESKRGAKLLSRTEYKYEFY